MKNVFEIEKTVSKENWTKCLDKAFKRLNKDAKIDGFRKGCAPKEIFVKQYGIESLYNEAFDDAISIAYEEIMKEGKYAPVVTPAVDIVKVDETEVTFKFKIITEPEYTLKKYKDLGVKKEVAKVTKKEIEEEINHLKNDLAEIVIKENGVVAEGDTAIIDFEGFMNGEAFEGGKGENYSLTIGSKTFIPGFEEGIIGHKENDEFELNLKFPEDYVENLKGKDVVFKVKINEVKTKVLPECGKEFYEDLGLKDISTKEEFEKEVEKTIKDKKSAELEDKFIDALIEKAIENLEVEINEEIISDEVHRLIDGYSHELQRQGIKLEDFMAMTGMSHEKMHEDLKPEALKRLKSRYVLESIAKDAKVEFTDEEVDKKAEELATNYGISKEELIKAYGSVDVIKYDMKMHRAIEILKENN